MRRLESLDALRGFDMLLIMGLAWLVADLCHLFPGTIADAIASQMEHAEWDGLRLYDTIFPLFLFIAGVTFPFSLEKSREMGLSNGRIVIKAVKRGLGLFLLGLIYNGFFDFDFATLRIPSVLGRIGVAWTLAALMQVYCPRGVRMAASVVILVGHSLLSGLVVAPDAPVGASPLGVEGNIAGWIDRVILGDHIYYRGQYDPEGLLGTLPAVVTALLGMACGELLLSGKTSECGKAGILAAAALAFSAAGILWNIVIPFNKALWSSSFVCATAGYSMAMLALFYWIIDVNGHRAWAFPLKVVGVNSIAIYMACRIIDFGSVSQFFFGGIAGLFPSEARGAVLLAGVVVIEWLAMYFLYKKKIYIKL